MHENKRVSLCETKCTVCRVVVVQREAGGAAADPGQADGSEAAENIQRGRSHPGSDCGARSAEGWRGGRERSKTSQDAGFDQRTSR